MDRDKRVVFFPTVGCRCGEEWEVPVHGWVYRPAEFSRLRRLGRALARRILARRLKKTDGGVGRFDVRIGSFLADNSRGVRVSVRVGEKDFVIGKSRGNGHVRGVARLGVEEAMEGWLPFYCEQWKAEGRALLLPVEGVSVVSDVDDTIKVTNVGVRREMLRNTFSREFASVPGMAELYQKWAKEGRTFHYVTGSPWHLYPFLKEFLEGQGFPAGTWHMRNFRLVGRDLPKTLLSARRVKEKHIEALMQCSRKRKFVLVGDSGESDAEMYAALAEKYPKQVEAIYIRKVDGSSTEKGKEMAGGLKGNRWKIFSDASEIPI